MNFDHLVVHPLTLDRWEDFEHLFGPRGASGGCWCMWFRLPRSQFDRLKGEGNQLGMKAIVESGEVPGLLAYLPDPAQGDSLIPVGWCSVAPRGNFPVLANSRILKPVDELPVWSIVCFFIHRKYRRQGLTVQLLKAAVEYARSHGAPAVEGYPVDPKSGASPDAFMYHGVSTAFRKAGFVEVARRSETRPIMRYLLETTA